MSENIKSLKGDKMENINNEILKNIILKLNTGEYNESWLRIKINKKGQIAKILLEKNISLNVATSKI